MLHCHIRLQCLGVYILLSTECCFYLPTCWGVTAPPRLPLCWPNEKIVAANQNLRLQNVPSQTGVLSGAVCVWWHRLCFISVATYERKAHGNVHCSEIQEFEASQKENKRKFENCLQTCDIRRAHTLTHCNCFLYWCVFCCVFSVCIFSCPVRGGVHSSSRRAPHIQLPKPC